MNAFRSFGTALLLFVSALAAPFGAHAQSDPTQSSPQSSGEVPDAVLLVARPELQSPVLSSSVLLVMPLEGGGHAGFILNKPTPMTVSDAFPDDEPSQKVRDRVYLGGPVNPNIIFALVRRAAAQGTSPGSIQFTKDLALAMTSDSVDDVIRNDATRARFFAGAMLWRPGELRQQVSQGAWYVRDADADVALSHNERLWEELVADSERHSRAF